MLFLASTQGKFPLSTQRAIPVNTEITHFWPPSPLSKKWDNIILAEGLLYSTGAWKKSREKWKGREGEQETDVSQAMLGFAWSQRNGGKGAWSMGMALAGRRAAAPCHPTVGRQHQRQHIRRYK